MRDSVGGRAQLIPIVLVAAVLGLAALPMGSAHAHEERPTSFPDGTGNVPVYRPLKERDAHPMRVVCKKGSAERIRSIDDRKLRRINKDLLGDCEFHLIQKAIDSVTRPGTTIYLLPGHYRERPNRDKPNCAKEPDQSGGEQGAPVLSYRQQRKCPHAQNLIGIFGDDHPRDGKRRCDAAVCDLQLEGTGQKPGDVMITGGFNKKGNFTKLNGIRGDRSDGLYVKNFTIELFEFNALYILETDGFVIDDVVGRYNDEYAFLTFASDHGLYKNCEGYRNGDSALYPGSASDLNADNPETGPLDRFAIEIKNCKAHHNALGYSGTAGNSVYVHDSEFYKNATGVVTDSVFPDHPGLPQDHGWYEDNSIHSNNVNFYGRYVHSGVCDKKPSKRGYRKGTVCPVIPAPVGTGMMIAGGNNNFVHMNEVFDNWRNGVMLFGVPAAVRGEPEKGLDTSHDNHYVDNVFGFAGDVADPNGLDVWWDDQGLGNCWQGNTSSHGEVTSNTLLPTGLPDCDSGGSDNPSETQKTLSLAPCVTYDRNDPELRDPPGCDWFDTPEEPQPEG